MTSYLQLQSISKQFPGVKALNDVSFEVAEGQVHGLVGENGAGKSTLLKILGGQYIPSDGKIFIGGIERQFRSARDAIAAGIAIIHQELQYVPDMSVVDNLLLGHFISKFGYLREGKALNLVRTELQRMGVDIDPHAKLRDLSIAQRQMVEICKSVMLDAKIIALDEPTSSLSHRETEILFRMIADLKKKNRVIIYISHRLEEIYRLCDSCTIFRDGRKVASFPVMAQVSQQELISQMVGREIKNIYGYQSRVLGEEMLRVDQVCGKHVATPLSFSVRQGEILGFFGLVGAGRSELMQLIYGIDKLKSGEIFLNGQKLPKTNIIESISHGIVFCPEDRKENGIVGGLSVSENINISARRHHRKFHFFVDDKQEAITADKFIARLQIRTPNRAQEIRFLSGGNQQKAILSRWLAEPEIKVIIMDEPTRGIDVGAKHEIYAVMYELVKRGCSIIMVSSELPEVLGVSDRIMVMCQGKIMGELDHADANEHKVLEMALPKSAHSSKPELETI